MMIQNLLRSIALTMLIYIILISQSQSQAAQTQPIVDDLTIDSSINKTLYWKHHLMKFQGNKVKLSAPTVLAGMFCFIASSISSAGGIGGGGLFIPILTLVAGLDLKTASTLSAFTVTGVSSANVIYNLYTRSAKFEGKTLIDYDVALLSEPSLLLGVSIGVICHNVFPEWLITVLFAIFLAWSTCKTCGNGVKHWKKESEYQQTRNRSEKMENGNCGESEEIKSLKSEEIKSLKPLVSSEGRESRFPWKKSVVLIAVWFSFFMIYLLRGNHYGKGIIPMKPCGVEYWTLTLSQIPLAIAFTAWMLRRKEAIACQDPNKQEVNKLLFPFLALLAGGLGGLFGIGGGMLISPLLLQVGFAPEVTAATCSFMVFFSSSMSAFQYLLLGTVETGTAFIFSIIGFIASIIGLVVLKKAIREWGRASLIVFAVATVMALSTILMTSFGALDVWEEYSSGSYMGFKRPC